MVVGAATRDVAADDPRGWRMGGGVAYGALTTAGLGLRTLAIVGVDAEAASATELDLLRLAGVDVVLVPMARGPIFDNVETPAGRVQSCVQPSDALPAVDAVAASAFELAAPAWLLVPVAGEVGDDWATLPKPTDLVGLGWQGLLRDLRAGEHTGRKAPAASALVQRANVVGVSHQDVVGGTRIAELVDLLGPRATLVLTDGIGGGLVLERDAGAGGSPLEIRYPAIPAERTVDPTGAGDVFLAALLAARAQPARLAGPPGRHGDLRLAAAAASLVVEAPGLLGVPDLPAVIRRMARPLAGRPA